MPTRKPKPRVPASRLSLTLTAPVGKALVPFLRRHLPAATALARSSVRDLSVVLLGDRAIGQLHEQFFKDPSTTDVITFPLDLDAKGQVVSGELYLCVPMARRQARMRKISAEQELLLYAIHGMLHLSGHDDTTAAAYDKMHQEEDRILRALGIGDVFARPPKGVAKQPPQRRKGSR
jgi:probable rRNA maturation factor